MIAQKRDEKKHSNKLHMNGLAYGLHISYSISFTYSFCYCWIHFIDKIIWLVCQNSAQCAHTHICSRLSRFLTCMRSLMMNFVPSVIWVKELNMDFPIRFLCANAHEKKLKERERERKKDRKCAHGVANSINNRNDNFWWVRLLVICHIAQKVLPFI